MGSITFRANAQVLIATGSQLIRDGLLQAMHSRRGLDVTTVTDGVDVFAYLANVGVPDVMVMDSVLAGSIRPRIRESGLDCRVLLLWSRPHSGEAMLPREPWVCGLLRICASAQELSGLVDAVTACDFSHAGKADACSSCAVKRTTSPPSLPLSVRELDVFQRLGRGEGVKAIATNLSLSVKTVETHRENIKRKLGLEDAAELFEAAILWRRGEYVGPASRLPGRGASGLTARGTRCCLQNGDSIRVARAGRA